MAQALETLVYTRPWHWGIATISDATHGGNIPDVSPETPVTANAYGCVVAVRHAQDVDLPAEAVWEEDTPWAEVTVTIAKWSSEADWVDLCPVPDTV